MYRNREDAALALVRCFQDRPLHEPVVLAIPRGGVVLGAILARALGADLDVVLARKLRAPDRPELAIGAVAEDGSVQFAEGVEDWYGDLEGYLEGEIRFQRAEILRRKALLRDRRPPVSVAGRSVIVVDDGLATGSTMMAALHALRGQGPHEIIVAVPVAAADRLPAVQALCDEVVCPIVAEHFLAIGHFYEDFSPVEDSQVAALLRASARREEPVAEVIGG